MTAVIFNQAKNVISNLVYGNPLQKDFEEACQKLDFERMSFCLQEGVNPNVLIKCDLSLVDDAFNSLLDLKEGEEQNKFYKLVIGYALYYIKGVRICADDCCTSLDELKALPEFSEIKVQVPACLLALCYKQDSLVESFIEKGAGAEGLDDFLWNYDLSHSQEDQATEFLVGAIPVVVTSLLKSNRASDVDQLVRLGLFNLDDFEIGDLIELQLVEAGSLEILDYIEGTEDFKEFIKENPDFIVKQASRVVMYNDGKSIEILQRLEKYLPQDFFIENQRRLLYDSIGRNTSIELLKYLISKKIDLKEFKIEAQNKYCVDSNFLRQASTYCPSLEVLEFIVDQGLDPTLLNDHGESLLFAADSDLIDHLVEKIGLDINQLNVFGQSALWSRLLNPIANMWGEADYKTAFSDSNFLAGIKLFKQGADVNVLCHEQNMIENLIDQASHSNDEHSQLCIKLRMQAFIKMGFDMSSLSSETKEGLAPYLTQDSKIDAFLDQLISGKSVADPQLNLLNRV